MEGKVDQTCSFEIIQGKTGQALALAADRLFRIGCYRSKQQSHNVVQWRDRKGVFHTCEIIFSTRYEEERDFIDIVHCGHFDLTVEFFTNDLVKYGLKANSN